MTSVTLRVTTTDRFNSKRSFKTLKGARAFAHRYVGKHPDVSETFRYAVGAFGDVKVEWDGCTSGELFPEEAEPARSGDREDRPSEY